jgi:Protein of unknown function (DUF3991)/Toprim-like
MTPNDPELDHLREKVNCAAVLERFETPWRLDRKGSTKGCLKYRRGKGEILIVNHGGRGWWDPRSEHKGDVFDLVQFLDPHLNFGEVRKVLRPLAGVNPAFPAAKRAEPKDPPEIPIPKRWARRPRIGPNSPAWLYLTNDRRLPPGVLIAARKADILREGPYGSPWFAHHDDHGIVTHIEIRGPAFKGSVRGGTKTLCRLLGGSRNLIRLVLAEAPIDALSVAAIEDIRADTIYAATGGGMGPRTIEAVNKILAKLKAHPNACFCSATDANPAGERYALHHRTLAAKTGVPFERLLPPVVGGDWNDVLKLGRAV